MIEFVCLNLFLISVFMIMSQSGHFFMILLSFEVVTLSLFFLCVGKMVIVGGGPSVLLALVFLVFSVCEASLGLGLLVSSMRCLGFDQLKSLSSLKF